MSQEYMEARQWPAVYDLCHTFLHVARVKTHKDMRELHTFHWEIHFVWFTT